MNKLASMRSQARRVVLTKSAGLVSDYLATIPTSMASGIPVVGQLASLAGSGGYIGGLVADPEGDGNPATSALSVVPGVGQFRLGQRRRRVMDASNAAGASGTANLVAEHLGGLTSPLVSAAAGGLIGSGLGAAIGGHNGARHGAGRGALAGAAVGLTAPVVAAIAAAIRRKRSKQEQIASDTTGRAVAKYLVPGLAAYDSAKRLGASTHYDAKRKGGKGEKKAAEAAFAEGFCKAAALMGADLAALVKAADGVSDWVNKNLPDYTPQERLVQELKAKRDRGIDIEKYRTSNVGNWAGMLGSTTTGTLLTSSALGNVTAAEEAGRLRGAKEWIRSVRKLAPGLSARHSGVAKAIGRLANAGAKTGLVGAALLPLVGGAALAKMFNSRRQVNNAIDQVQGGGVYNALKRVVNKMRGA